MTQPERVDILLVEDNPHERELTLRALKKGEGLDRVLVVEDGKEALDVLFAQGPHRRRCPDALPRLVLLDLKLPKVDGLEVLRQIRANETTRNVPVVVLTSSQEDTDVAESYRLGANSYTLKPVDFDTFVLCIAKIRDYWLTCNRLPR